MTTTCAPQTRPGTAMAPGGPRRLTHDAAPEEVRAGYDVSGLVRVLRESGLTGRGGAGFPAWRKLDAVATAAAGGARPVVVGNAAEGEPASRKDAWLLRNRPHLVLDGLATVAGAVGASETYLYVGAAALVAHLQGLAAERHRRRLDPISVRVVAAPETFLAGEETAAVGWLGGRAAAPRSKPPLVVHRGLRGRPTLVQNVETLAHLALIARFGPEWFRGQGTAEEPGTLLVTVSGAVRRPGIAEVAHGTPLVDVVDRAGGAPVPVSAVLSGGYHGGWVSAAALPAATMSRPVLDGLGSSLGAGVVVVLPASSCGIRETARAVDYLARESAEQCGPCLNGLPRLAALLSGLAAGRADRGAVTELHRIAGLVVGRGACHHPDGTTRLLRSCLRVFAAEVDQHLGGRCNATGTAPVLPIHH